MKAARVWSAVLATLLVTAGVAPATATSREPFVEVVDPAEGAVVSRSATPTLEVTGRIDRADVPARSARTFYLSRQNCYSSSPEERNTQLKLEATQDAEGCGDVATHVVTTVNRFYYDPPFSFTAFEGLPLALDKDGTVTGTLVVGSDPGYEVASAGLVSVTIRLYTGLPDPTCNHYCRPIPVSDQVIGESVHEYQVLPGQGDRMIPFEFDVRDDIPDRISELFMRIWVRGYYLGHGALRLSGRSFITVPTMTRAVEVSFDSPDFAQDRTTHAIVAPDGSWTAPIDLVATGPRTVYVGLRDEEWASLATASRSIVVTS